jgi:hypothetical protein
VVVVVVVVVAVVAVVVVVMVAVVVVMMAVVTTQPMIAQFKESTDLVRVGWRDSQELCKFRLSENKDYAFYTEVTNIFYFRNIRKGRICKLII